MPVVIPRGAVSRTTDPAGTLALFLQETFPEAQSLSSTPQEARLGLHPVCPLVLVTAVGGALLAGAMAHLP
jgi:hypothetical protein